MPQTERSRTELEALLDDNNTGDITPQIHRDGLLGSALGGYAGLIQTIAGGVAQMAGVDATPVIMDIWDVVSVQSVDDNTDGATASLVSKKLTPGVKGVYLLAFYAAFTLSKNNAKVVFRAFLNDAGTDLELDRFFSNGANIAAVSMSHPFRLNAGDDVDFRVSTDAGPLDIDFTSGGMSIVRVG